MAFTRFNYDDSRTKKKLQESTGPGRYSLNMPGNGTSPCFFNDPQIRMQKWGANLDNVINGAPIDIDSDLKGVTRKLTKYSQKSQFPNSGVPITQKVEYPICGDALTDESRATHPAWKYRALPQNREYPLFLNPQENVCMRFHNNLNTRLLERDNFVPKIPCLKEK
jgi:hypothetical protein|tara:strand:+ start:40 stop:537 length:498 start_codon:yes stop_codon:yes gene_type:complete